MHRDNAIINTRIHNRRDILFNDYTNPEIPRVSKSV